MRYFKFIIILLFLTSCSNSKMSSSHFGMIAGGTTATYGCLELLNTNHYLTAACAVGGAWVGSNILMNKSDRNVHSAVFVDHLNTAPSYGSSYVNWHNPNTGNQGGIKITRSYIKAGFKCADYTSTVNIQSSWPMMSVGGLDRSTEFGIACQLPDGRWRIIESVS